MRSNSSASLSLRTTATTKLIEQDGGSLRMAVALFLYVLLLPLQIML